MMEPKMYTKGIFNYVFETRQEKKIVDDEIVVSTRSEITVYERDDANAATRIVGYIRKDGQGAVYNLAPGADLLLHYPVIEALAAGTPEAVEGLMELQMV